MKKLRFLLLLIAFSFLLSCSKKIEKPKKFLEQKEMINLLYDLNLFTSMQIFSNDDTLVKNMSSKTILKTYGLDSLAFLELNNYYLNQPEVYEVIFDSINKRFKKKIEETEALADDPKDTLSHKNELPIKRLKMLTK